jgi:LuxR family quorum sensing-dependent transcriptional regulator
MALTGDRYGKRIMDFVDRLRRLDDYNEICRSLAAELGELGFSWLTIWSLPRPGQNLVDCVYFNTRPQEFVERYIEKNYATVDPVVTTLRETLDPLSWSDIPMRRPLQKIEWAVYADAREFGANDGLTVPIVTPSGQVAVVSPCGFGPDLSRRGRAAVEIIGIYGFHALQRVMSKRPLVTRQREPLSPREKEIMHWVAAGKTDDDIGEILSLSAAEVAGHIEIAKHKLDSLRRYHAVVQALRLGEIAV